MVNPTPAAEIEIDVALVRALLAEQAPQYAERPLAVLASGWDNTMLELGDDLLVRLPRREVAVELVRSEQRWLPELAPLLPVAVPVPVVFGRPSAIFPWPWSVVAHVQGADALSTPPDGAAASEMLAGFFSALHRPAPDDAPLNPVRGGPLIERDEITEQRFERLTSWLDEVADIDQLRARWRQAVEADPHSGPPLWIHGDVHPGNVIVCDDRIVSVIDFGDLTSGDPATDLGSAWMFFDEPERSSLRSLLDADEPTWRRARGWALSVALAIADSSADNPRYEALAARTVARIAAEPV